MSGRDRTITPCEVHDLIADGHIIVIYQDYVLKLDSWLEKHPGGSLAILHMVGKDATDEIDAYVIPGFLSLTHPCMHLRCAALQCAIPQSFDLLERLDLDRPLRICSIQFIKVVIMLTHPAGQQLPSPSNTQDHEGLPHRPKTSWTLAKLDTTN